MERNLLNFLLLVIGRFCPSLASPRSRKWACFSCSVGVIAGVVFLVGGCSTAPKKTDQKDLTKLSLDMQEDAQKLRDAGNLNAAVAKYQEALKSF